MPVRSSALGLPQALVENFAGLVRAAAALSRNTQLALQIAEGAGSVFDAGVDLFFGDAVTETDVHARLLLKAKIVSNQIQVVNTIANHSY
jgi:hypothetical protein